MYYEYEIKHLFISPNNETCTQIVETQITNRVVQIIFQKKKRAFKKCHFSCVAHERMVIEVVEVVLYSSEENVRAKRSVMHWFINSLITLPCSHISLILFIFNIFEKKHVTFSLHRCTHVHNSNEHHHHWQNSPFWVTAFLEEYSEILPDLPSIGPNFPTIFFLQNKLVSPAFNPQPGWPGFSTYVPQWQRGPVVPPSTGFLPFYYQF